MKIIVKHAKPITPGEKEILIEAPLNAPDNEARVTINGTEYIIALKKSEAKAAE